MNGGALRMNSVYAKLNLIDFSMHVDRISMELPILYLKGRQVEISKFSYFFCPYKQCRP